ncbi:TPA: type V toxin-antitoxin system endoribonuclease antitoxin GhoS [Escherichia coli]|nr:type V toxin-antitoxin system endoribonuclease antitoxin GhoS [Escherichia coli]
MAKFTVRVELRDSKDADYDELHDLMEENGFYRTIFAESGKEYFLPSAEYTYSSKTKSCSDVADLAESVASEVSKKPKILVTESCNRCRRNLDRA